MANLTAERMEIESGFNDIINLHPKRSYEKTGCSGCREDPEYELLRQGITCTDHRECVKGSLYVPKFGVKGFNRH